MLFMTWIPYVYLLSIIVNEPKQIVQETSKKSYTSQQETMIGLVKEKNYGEINLKEEIICCKDQNRISREFPTSKKLLNVHNKSKKETQTERPLLKLETYNSLSSL